MDAFNSKYQGKVLDMPELQNPLQTSDRVFKTIRDIEGRPMGFTTEGTGRITDGAIKGFKGHGANQAVTRGFKTSDILKIVGEGNAVEAMGRFGPQMRYTLGGNTVVVNAQGQIISVFSNTLGTANGLGQGFFIPF